MRVDTPRVCACTEPPSRGVLKNGSEQGAPALCQRKPAHGFPGVRAATPPRSFRGYEVLALPQPLLPLP